MGFLENDPLSDEQCMTLLGRAQLGRVALSLRALPVVVPVRYMLRDGALLFTTTGEELTRALHGNIAALQADGFDEDSGRRWSVFATGSVGIVESLETVASMLSGPPSAGIESSLFRLKPTILSGRWIDTL